jgi:hypothetical protein
MESTRRGSLYACRSVLSGYTTAVSPHFSLFCRESVPEVKQCLDSWYDVSHHRLVVQFKFRAKTPQEQRGGGNISNFYCNSESYRHY